MFSVMSMVAPMMMLLKRETAQDTHGEVSDLERKFLDVMQETLAKCRNEEGIVDGKKLTDLVQTLENFNNNASQKAGKKSIDLYIEKKIELMSVQINYFEEKRILNKRGIQLLDQLIKSNQLLSKEDEETTILNEDIQS